jgi:hypothetical protein
MLIVLLSLLKQYEIVGQNQSQQGCSTYIQIHCDVRVLFRKIVLIHSYLNICLKPTYINVFFLGYIFQNFESILAYFTHEP